MASRSLPCLFQASSLAQAFVMVVETPYFAVSAKDGSYTIKDVPAGKYTLKIWHEKLKGAPVAIAVPDSGVVKQDFAIQK